MDGWMSGQMDGLGFEAFRTDKNEKDHCTVSELNVKYVCEKQRAMIEDRKAERQNQKCWKTQLQHLYICFILAHTFFGP